MILRAVVFDFDGVIANSEPLHFRGFRDVLADEGVTLTERQYYDLYLGYDDAGAFTAVARDREQSWTADHIAELIRRKAHRVEMLEREGSLLFPGAFQLIRSIAPRCPLAIASGAQRDEIIRVLQREQLAGYFKAIVAAGDTVMGKPAADPYRRAVSLLGESIAQPLSPAECVAIEDSRWGLESAIAAGLRTVAVTQTYPAAELSMADVIVPAVSAITWEILSGIRPR